MGLRLFFLPNFQGAMFIQGATFIPDSRVAIALLYAAAVGFLGPGTLREALWMNALFRIVIRPSSYYYAFCWYVNLS